MRNNKKLAPLFIVLLLTVLIVGAPLSVSAAGNPTISVGSAEETKAGAEFTVAVSIENNPGFSGMALSLDYDHDALELVSFSKNGILNSGSIAENVDGDALAFLSMANVTDDGVLFSATFKVKNGAKSGDYPIAASLRENLEKNFVNADTKAVPVSFAAGTVTVAGTADGTGNPGTGTDNPGTDNPGTGTDNPGTGTDKPGTDNPGTETDKPGTDTVGNDGNSGTDTNPGTSDGGSAYKAVAADGSALDILLREQPGSTNVRQYSLDGGATWLTVPEDGIITTDDDKTISVYGEGDADYYVKDYAAPTTSGTAAKTAQAGNILLIIVIIVVIAVVIALILRAGKRKRAAG
jgi:hypothetical protein